MASKPGVLAKYSWRVLLALAGMLAPWQAAQAAYMQVEILSNTVSGMVLPNLNLGKINRPRGYSLMPFYFRVTLPANNNSNWGVELYSNNLQVLGSARSSGGLYRGLRAAISNVDLSVPIFWQVYDYDQNVAASWGLPSSVTTVAGGLAIDLSTLRYWSTLYDAYDIDRDPTQNPVSDPLWNAERPLRTVASAEGLGSSPRAGRPFTTSNAFIYFGMDTTTVNGEDYSGLLTLDLFSIPFDFNTGCYATPNPFRPMRGERAYFNFYTNRPDSKVIIKIYDPTGFPVVTLENTRYWDGRNSQHHYVEGGLYLYQIETEGHLISGTVVVIK